MFIASDIYLPSGTTQFYNNWQSTVYKFDSSSFYNWEQDNLPLYDLENRDLEFWAKLGYPVKDGFSGSPALMFAVSGDAPFSGESSGMIFKTVSSVINILPEIISMPIIIEVANYGNLGELNLTNLKFKDRGGLEIINRNFAVLPAVDSSGNATTRWNSLGSGGLLSSLEGSLTILGNKVLSLNSFVVSGDGLNTPEDRYEGKNIMYLCRAQAFAAAASNGRPCSAILSLNWDKDVDGGGTQHFINSGTANTFRSPLIDWSSKDPTASGYDFNAINGLTSNAMRRALNTASQAAGTMFGYIFGNWFTKVNIKNCNGTIYLRNFAVDGGTGSNSTLSHNTQDGFSIENSKLTLENSLAIRCKQTGFRFVNSDIVLNRGLVAHRIYTLDSSSTRNTYEAVGLRAVNSNIIVSSSPYASGINNSYQFSKCPIGVELLNSRWIGGQSRKQTGSASGLTYLQTFYNNRSGIKLNNSYMEIPGRIDSYNNNIGAELSNSKLILNEGTFENNQSYGIKAENAFIQYNNDLYQFTKVLTCDPDGQLYFSKNGVNLLLDKSNLIYTDGDSLASKYGKFYVVDSVGVTNASGTPISLPNIQAFNGSIAKIIQPYVTNNQSNLRATNPIYGVLATVKNNSKIVFIGTKDSVSIFEGPGLYSLQKYLAGIYANNASIVEFQGPTLICNTGVAVLAEDESVINLVPPRDDHGNLLITSFDLSNALNHSKIELHATRACLVANGNSIINMENLGDYKVFWPTSQTSAVDYNYADGFGIASCVSGGYLQFYPNAQDQNVINASSGRYNIDSTDGNQGIIASPALGANNFILTNFVNSGILKYSTGGMCVRALNGSLVKVKNVNFPCGWDNTSAIVYDASSGNCDLLRIWNIGTDSKLEASYLSVSSSYPSLVGYYGPCAVYLSGNNPASSVPSNTPDSSSLAVLDFYGLSGSQTGTNYGPFRIYVSVNGPAKFLNYYVNSGLVYNNAYQTWAQGYNPSGPLSAAPAVSSYYANLTTSTFLTTSAMLDAGYRTRIRLDQSAADTFANAKNGALARSGRIPICTIYRSTTDAGGEAYAVTGAGQGIGFLSVNIFDLSRVN